MANLQILDGASATKYISKSGAGTDADPFVDAPIHFPQGGSDIFGTLRTGQNLNHTEVQFYRHTPSALLTVTSTNGGTATNSVGAGLFATSTNTSGTVRGISFAPVMYRGGSEIYIIFTAAFVAGVASSSMRYGLFNLALTEGVFIGYEGTSFGVTIRNNSVDTTVAKGSWNTDTLTGASGSKFTRGGTAEAINLANLNVYRIRLGWVSGAPIEYEVLAPDGHWVLFHRNRYPNSAAVPSIRTADLYPVIDITKSTAGATDLQILTGCFAAGTTYQSATLHLDGEGSMTAANRNILNEIASDNGTDCLLYRSIGLQINVAAGTVTAGAITFEGSNDNVNWSPIFLFDQKENLCITTYTLVASTNRYFAGNIANRYFRVRISQGITGTTTGVQCFATLSIANYQENTKIVRGTPLADRVANTNGTATAFTNLGAGGTGVKNFLTNISIYNSSTTNGFVDIRDGTGGAILLSLACPAQSGAVYSFDPPIIQPTTNTALAYDVSAAITTVYINASGYQNK
jgi:hypothetical protein